MSHKTVAVFSISDSLGGAEQVLFKIAKFYSEQRKNMVKVCFLKPPSNSYWRDNLNEDVEIIYLNNSFTALFRHLWKAKFNLVFSSHLMFNSLLGICRTIGLLNTKKLIVRESTQVFGRYSGSKLFQYKLAYFFGYRRVDLIVCQTQRMADALRENVPYLFRRTKVEIISNPFDYPNDDLVNEKIAYLNNNMVVSAGRLIPEKGFDVLIESFAGVVKKNPSMHLIILGEGKERMKLEKIISELDLQENVKLKGFVENVYPYFRHAQLCIVSSIKEGFPNVLLQMMSQNNNVISTNCAGGITDLKGVLVIEPNDIDALEEAMNSMLEESTDNRNIFDLELRQRNINSFVEKIEKKLLYV